MNTKPYVDLMCSWRVSSFCDTSGTRRFILWWQVIKKENQTDAFLQNNILQFLKQKAASSQNSSKTKQAHQVKQGYHISILVLALY